MAELEGTRASAEFCVRSIAPDVCKSPSTPVPYNIVSFFNCAVNFSTNVNFRQQPVFRHNSRLTTVIGNEPGVGGGIYSQVNKGWCRPMDGTSSTTIRVNGHLVPRHETTYMFMNCAGPEGTPNTVGQVFFLGNMLPGPVAPSGKIPQGSFCGTPDITQKLQDLAGGSIDDLIKKGQTLYDLAKTDWSDPSAVLGAIGGVAGIAGLQDIASAAKQAKELYDTGEKLLSTDWSDPKQALAAIAGVANVANMGDIAKAAQMASKIRDAIQADWSDLRQAFSAARNIMQATGLNEMFSQMASNAILGSNIPVNTRGNLPAIFPPPGGNPSGVGSPTGGTPAGPSRAHGTACHIPPSPSGTPRFPLNQQVLDYFKEHNPVAYDRYNMLSDDQKCRAFVEIANPRRGEKQGDEHSRAAMYIPGEGFSSSKAELDSLPNISRYLPDGFSSLFVASKESRSVGRFFGIEQKEGNAYLFGGLIDLGSPGMPGAGTASTWWVPDRILNADMSAYYDKHDRDFYGGDVRLSDLGKILGHELDSLRAGATWNPLQLPLQALYSAATTAAGVGTATFNSLGDAMSGLFGIGSTPTTGDSSPLVNSILPGGCIPDLGMGPSVGGLPGMTSIPGGPPGGGGCFPGSSGATPAGPAPVTVSCPEGDASGAGTDGVVITIYAGNPSAEADAILAEIKQANDEALAEAREKERNEAEMAEAEKAAAEAEAQKAAGETGSKETSEKAKTSEEVDKAAQPVPDPVTDESVHQANSNNSEQTDQQDSTVSHEISSFEEKSPVEQGLIPPCPDTQSEAENNANFCRDRLSEKYGAHGNKPDFRSHGTGTVGGNQCIYDPTSGKLDESRDHRGTIDQVGPAVGRKDNGDCEGSTLSKLQHGIDDYLPYVLNKEGYKDHQDCMRDKGVPSGTAGTPQFPSGISDEDLRRIHEECSPKPYIPPPMYAPHPLFHGKYIGPNGEFLDEAEVRLRTEA